MLVWAERRTDPPVGTARRTTTRPTSRAPSRSARGPDGARRRIPARCPPAGRRCPAPPCPRSATASASTLSRHTSRDRLPGFAGPLRGAAVPGRPIRIPPTYRTSTRRSVTTTSAEASGKLLPSAPRSSQEFQVIAALTATPVPVREGPRAARGPASPGPVLMRCRGRVLADLACPGLRPPSGAEPCGRRQFSRGSIRGRLQRALRARRFHGRTGQLLQCPTAPPPVGDARASGTDHSGHGAAHRWLRHPRAQERHHRLVRGGWIGRHRPPDNRADPLRCWTGAVTPSARNPLGDLGLPLHRSDAASRRVPRPRPRATALPWAEVVAL